MSLILTVRPIQQLSMDHRHRKKAYTRASRLALALAFVDPDAVIAANRQSWKTLVEDFRNAEAPPPGVVVSCGWWELG